MSECKDYAMSLAEIDNGSARIRLDQSIDKAYADAKEKPTQSGPRTVTLSVKVYPVMDKETGEKEILVRTNIKTDIPSEELRPLE